MKSHVYMLPLTVILIKGDRIMEVQVAKTTNGIEEQVIKIISEEDKKNPLADQEISSKLYISRSRTGEIRNALGIPDAQERRKTLLQEEIKRILKAKPNISERNLTTELNKLGFHISRNTITNSFFDTLQTSGFAKNAKIMQESSENNKPSDIFLTMIGHERSLKPKIEQAKAAILYPPNGLHTLIIGAPGVGKTELAELMYKFALAYKKTNVNDYPFIPFNCADYAENPQLLLAQLFGYRKGAFTGAETDQDGLVTKADGGILFLDEVHRLPPNGQEMLFQLIDKGHYRRLGETNALHKAKVMIIAATSEDIEKNLLITFRRRISMVIELPSLALRTLEERLDMIREFFFQEATLLNKKIIVTVQALRSLLSYNCVGNIGELRSDIQVSCAKGFLEYVTNDLEDDSIMIDVPTLPIHISKSLYNIVWDRKKVEKILSDDLIFLPGTKMFEKVKESAYTFPNDIYKNIEVEYQQLQQQGLSDEIINRIITDGLETKLKKIINQIKNNKYNLITKDLKVIVRPEIILLVEKMLTIAEVQLGSFDNTLFYCLATHLNASIDRIKNCKYNSSLCLHNVKQYYTREYEVAKEMASLTKEHLGIELPEEEVGFIAMYLKATTNKDVYDTATIGIVVVSHGNVAQGMVSVANRFLGVDLVKAVEMSLDEKIEIAFKRTLEAVMEVDQGKGVLLLVDMGSLDTFGNQITLQTGIAIRTITRTDTLMVIDAVRKILLPENNLDMVADSLTKEKIIKISHLDKNRTKSNYAIICFCLTGEGVAQYIANIIKKKVLRICNTINIIPIGILDTVTIKEQIDEIMQNSNILIIVGSINERYHDIPFISAAEVIQNGPQKLIEMVQTRYEASQMYLDNAFSKVFNKELIEINEEVKSKKEALVLLVNKLVDKSYVTENYIKGVMAREKMGSTVINNCLAIPHGYGEDIIKSGIGILVLKKAIEWESGIMISLIFMLALNEQSQNEFQRVYRIISNLDIISQIEKAENVDAVFHLLENA